MFNFHAFVLPSYRNLSKQAISHRVTMKTCRVYNLTFELAIHDLYIVTSILELIIKSSNIFYVRLFQISSTSMISKNFIIRRIRKKIVEISVPFSIRYSSHILFDKNSNERIKRITSSQRFGLLNLCVNVRRWRRRWYNDEHVKNSWNEWTIRVFFAYGSLDSDLTFKFLDGSMYP